ncbi:prefoldin subunit 5 [Arthrobacter sp. 2762]
MTTAVGSPEVSADTLIGISAGADLTGGSLPVDRVTVITGAITSESEYSLLPLDAVLVRSLDDFRSVRSSDGQSFLVTKSGFSVATELLGLGELSPDSPITWSLQAPLDQTLEQISFLGLPEQIAVQRVRGTIDRVVVSTAKDVAGRLDLESFQAGLAVNAVLIGHECGNQPLERDGSLQELEELRRKHLSLLEVLAPVVDQAPVEDATAVAKSEDVLKLEKELLLLHGRYDALDAEHQALDSRYQALDGKHQALDSRYQALDSEHQALDSRYQALDSEHQALDSRYNALDSEHHALVGKHSALDKKYQALANSRLGKLTLRFWGRKTSGANKMQSKEEA